MMRDGEAEGFCSYVIFRGGKVHSLYKTRDRESRYIIARRLVSLTAYFKVSFPALLKALDYSTD